MLNKPIEQMDFKELRKTVQELSDTIAVMKRKYEDILYNIDESNFSGAYQVIVENQRAEVKIDKAMISAIVQGELTGDILNKYLTGIIISPHEIKLIDDPWYLIFSGKGLKIYDGMDQAEGWAIEPDRAGFGGILNYYVNNGVCYTFGTGISGEGYHNTDMVLKALNGQRGRFVVDVTNSGNKEIRFVGMQEPVENAPHIYANGHLLATQDWVLGGINAVAVFG